VADSLVTTSPIVKQLLLFHRIPGTKVLWCPQAKRVIVYNLFGPRVKTRNQLMKKRVCAVVVTYNRQELLRQCLLALRPQMGDGDCILVVNNAATDATSSMLRGEFPDVTVLDLPENIGGAGGFHAGMKWAFDAGYEWMWLMDDDGRPAPDCLSLLLQSARPNCVLVPAQQDEKGNLYGFALLRNGERRDATSEIAAQGKAVSGKFLFAFVGPLIRREIVMRIGLPNPEFFIWFDDYEYALRIHGVRGAQIIAVPKARFHHDIYGVVREVSVLGRRSLRASQAAWKTYYGTRNQLYALRAHHRRHDFGSYYRTQIQHLLGDIIYEPDRWQRASLRLKGLRDGLLGRLGKRVQP
jgi:rhamnopyranosyl-N-acetylglucosaminyl-diphospho-decaprenol beta-1,3/1,4-galactofuranosyltransferase